MRNRMTAKVLVVAAISAAAAAAGVPAVYGTTGTFASDGNIYPFSTATPSLDTIDGTAAAAWLNGVIPNGAGDTANFTYNTTGFLHTTTGYFSQINLPSNWTLGTLNLQADGGNFTGYGITDTLLFVNGFTSLVMDNGASQAQINISPTNHAVILIDSNIKLNSDTVWHADGGPSDGIQSNSIDPASTKNLIIEGGGYVGVNGGNAFTNSKILLNHGTFQMNNSTGSMFGSGANAGIYVAQGGTIFGSYAATDFTAPIHLLGTGNRLNGTLVWDHTGNGTTSPYGITLDGDTWIAYASTNAGSGINVPIGESTPSALTASFYSKADRGLTLGAANTYTGGTVVMKFGSPLNITAAGSVMNNITVQGGGIVGLTSTSNITNGGKVILQAGTLANATGSNFGGASTNFVNPNGNFVSVPGILRLDADFDPVSIIDTSSVGGVTLGVDSSTSFNVAAWGNGSMRFGAMNPASGNVVRNYTGTLSAVNGSPTTLRLGYTGGNEGVYAGVYTKAVLQISNAIGSVSDVDIRSGVVSYNAPQTYTGPTTVNYDGTLNALSTMTANASPITVNATGALNMLQTGAVTNAMITVNGGGTATLSQTGVANGGVTVSGTNPGNGVSNPYRGILNYNVTGAATVAGGGVTINAMGQVNLAQTPTTADKFTINDLGTIRGNSTQLSALVTAGVLTANNGAIFLNTSAGSGIGSISALTATLGTSGQYYYGLGATALAGENYTVGTASGTPWKGIAGSGDALVGTATLAAGGFINLAGAADIVQVSWALSNNNLGNIGSGDGNGLSTAAQFRVNAPIIGGSTSDPVTFRGGGGFIRLGNANTFLASQVIIDAVQVITDPGFNAGGVFTDGTLGDSNNAVTLQNGGRWYMGDSVASQQMTLPAGRIITVGTGGGGLGVGGSLAQPIEMTIANANQISTINNSTTFTKYGLGTLKLSAIMSTFTGNVNVLGGALQLDNPSALMNANSISLGTAKQALVSQFVNVAASGFPIINTANGTRVDGTNVAVSYGALLLDPAASYTGPAALANIPLNGGAVGYTGNASLNPTTLNLGTQTYPSSLSVKPVAQDEIGGNQVDQGVMQQVKIAHFQGNPGSATPTTLTLTAPLVDVGGPVMLLKGGHNMTLDLTGASNTTYTGGTLIYDGVVNINDATQLGAGAVEMTSAYSTTVTDPAGQLHIMDNGTTHQVTFSANQFFRFAGTNTTVGTIAGTTRTGAYINVDNGVTATINAIDNSLTASGMIAKTGLGTLKVNMAQNLLTRAGLTYGAYLGAGTLEVDSMPATGTSSSTVRSLVFDGGNLTVHAPPAAANFGDLMNNGNYGFADMQVRDTVTGTINIDSNALFRLSTNAVTNWNGTVIINGADSTAEALFTVANGSVATTNGNGVLDIHGGRVAVINDNGAGTVIPWNNPLFTIKLQGGELDGNDYQNSNIRTTYNANGSIYANVAISNTFGTPVLGGAYPTTIAGSGNTTWDGALTKNGSGWLTFNRNGGTFTATANAALTINGGQVVIDGNDAFADASFQTNKVPIVNNSVTDTGSGYGLLFKSNDALTLNRVVKQITGTGGTQVAAGVTVIVDPVATGGVITQNLLDVAGGIRNDTGSTTMTPALDPATAAAVTINGNNASALTIEATGVAKVGDVTLAGAGTGGVVASGGQLIAKSLTISQATGAFTMNTGSTVTLTNPVVTNNGTFTYNGGTTNATAINSTTPTGQLVLNANLALSEVRQSVKVQVNANSALTLTASGGPTTGGTDANVSRMGSLVLSGAADAWTSKLDVNDNKVIIDNANSAVAAATYTQTNNQLKQGFDNGAWDGQGIVSTKAQTNVNNGVPVTIGVINNDDGSGNPAFFHDGTDLPQFGGQNVNGTAVLTKYTYFGDADLSGTVDAVDYTFFVAGVQSGGTLTGWEWGDFDYSGTIDAVDYTFFVFGVQGQGAALAGGGSGPTSVPEPASLALLGLGGLLMLKRRNRKS